MKPGPKSLGIGVYKILNKENGNCYVGGTIQSFRRRWWVHKKDLRLRKHFNQYLQNAWDKHGEKSFEFVVLEVVDDPNKILEREQFWIDTLKPEYNILPIAAHPNLGIPHSDAAKLKISEASKKHWADPEITRRRVKNIRRARRSNEARIQTGKITSELWRDDKYRKNVISGQKEAFSRLGEKWRSDRTKKQWAGRSEKERRAIGLRIWETRRKNARNEGT